MCRRPQAKWPELRREFPDIELHLIGPLQSNKASEAIALFDVIETVDRDKIAAALAGRAASRAARRGFSSRSTPDRSRRRPGSSPPPPRTSSPDAARLHGLAIDGLMCIPPAEDNPGPHFALLDKLAGEAGVSGLSMGMSADYELAVAFGATSVRVGSAIFGAR